MDQPNNYPFEIKPLPEEELADMFKYRKGLQRNYFRVGPNGFLLPSHMMEICLDVYNMELRPSDVFVATFPRSGTTWTQELVWLISNDFDYKKAAEVKLVHRFPYLGNSLGDFIQQWTKNNPTDIREVQSFEISSSSRIKMLAETPSPRFFKTHSPLSLLPPTILNTAKVVYVARDPRDVAVSCNNFCKSFKTIDFTENFNIYWKLFLEHKVAFAPYFPHVKEAWEKRNHPNMLFLFYEELSKDLPAVVRRVAQFLKKPVSEDQVSRLCDHLHIDNFRQNKSVNLDHLKKIGMFNEDKKLSFIREGKVGGWRAHFNEEMAAQAEHWIEENLRDTDLTFPQ